MAELHQIFYACVVAVAIGRLAYGSAADSLRWYGWLAGTGLARWRRQTRQTDRQEIFRSGPALAWLVLDHVTASPRDPAALARLSLTHAVLLITQYYSCLLHIFFC